MGLSPRGRATCATLLVLMVAAHSAAGQPISAAETAFQRGREALQVGKYQEACAAFEQSQRLEPQLLTQFNIALCDEQLGKLASALALYRELAAKDDNPQRRAKSADMVMQLSARVPRLRVEIVDNRRGVPPGLELTVNGVRATNFKDMPIDLGSNRVVAHAPGFIEWVGEATAKVERQRVVVTIKLDPDPSVTSVDPVRPPEPHVAPPPVPGPGPIEGPAMAGRKKLGVALMVGGGVAIAGGITFGLLARSKWHEAKDVCGGTTCQTQDELDRGQALVDTARTRGTIATTLVIAGGLIAAGGVVLWATAPRHDRSLAIAPAASPSSLGVAVLGRF